MRDAIAQNIPDPVVVSVEFVICNAPVWQGRSRESVILQRADTVTFIWRSFECDAWRRFHSVPVLAVIEYGGVCVVFLSGRHFLCIHGEDIGRASCRGGVCQYV